MMLLVLAVRKPQAEKQTRNGNKEEDFLPALTSRLSRFRAFDISFAKVIKVFSCIEVGGLASLK